jgi:polysaccharide biosynthesis/export protein ExoF
MNILIVKLFGVTALGAVAGGTVAVTTPGLAPAEMSDWTKVAWTTTVAALDAAMQGEAARPTPAPIEVAPAEAIPAATTVPDRFPPEMREAAPLLPPVGGERSAGAFRIGDKLKIGFYERLEFDEEKWGRQRPPRAAFQQRMELSGEYTVSDDGLISVPLVGSFPATKRNAQELEVALANAAEAVIGRRGFVTIGAVERQPVYVLGPVKNPGAYKYAPGMTVLHAVALAGGLERAPNEPWQRMEAVRETGRRHGAIERTTRLMARVAVLKSEYRGGQPQVPPRLVEMIGGEGARAAVREQIERRQSVLWMRRIRESTAEAAFENAKREVATLADGIVPIEENVKMRASRVESLRALKNNNIVANPVLVQAQGELSDVQERRSAALNSLGLAKYRYTTTEQELARLRAETQVALEQEIAAAEQDIVDAEREIGSSDGVLTVVQAGVLRTASPAGEMSLDYEIVRQSAQGAILIASAGIASLEPGDLVRVHARTKADAPTVEAKLPGADSRVGLSGPAPTSSNIRSR